MTILTKSNTRTRPLTDVDKLNEFALTNRIDIKRILIKVNDNEDLLSIETTNTKLLNFCKTTLGLT